MSKKKRKIKNLMLDRETSHGGWPEGPSRGWIDKRPVNVVITDWLEKMGMLDTPEHARLSESKLRVLIRIALKRHAE
jgi:hypothetical protein